MFKLVVNDSQCNTITVTLLDSIGTHWTALVYWNLLGRTIVAKSIIREKMKKLS